MNAHDAVAAACDIAAAEARHVIDDEVYVSVGLIRNALNGLGGGHDWVGSQGDAPPDGHQMPDPAVVLTDAERTVLRKALTSVSPLTAVPPTVRRIVTARTAEAAARLAAVEAAVIDCPHGERHYYAADATCQRCEMPSWVEALLRAALSATAPDAGEDDAREADRAALAWWASAWADARQALAGCKDHMDEHAYDELSTILDDEPNDHLGEAYPAPDAGQREAHLMTVPHDGHEPDATCPNCRPVQP